MYVRLNERAVGGPGVKMGCLQANKCVFCFSMGG